MSVDFLIRSMYEYKWNMTVNLVGGTGHNIPNDNCVEIQVHNIKSQLKVRAQINRLNPQKNICLTSQVIGEIREQLMKTTHLYKTKRFRPPVENTKDIQLIVECLRKNGPIKDLTWPAFGNIKDPIKCIDVNKLHDWLKHQNIVAK